VTAAIFGLLGVAIGALLSGAVSYAIESRRERKDAIVGARIVSQEIQMFQADVESWIRNRAIPEELDLRTDAWEEHKLALARFLPPPDWEMVGATYTWIHLLTTDPWPPGAIPEAKLDFFEGIQSEVIGGVKSLEPLVEQMRPKVPWRIRQMRRRRVRQAQREAWP
jgi:hypothetical protein